MTEEEYKKRCEERIPKLEENGFHQEWRGSWVHESGTGYFSTYQAMELSDALFERLIKVKGVFDDMFEICSSCSKKMVMAPPTNKCQTMWECQSCGETVSYLTVKGMETYFK